MTSILTKSQYKTEIRTFTVPEGDKDLAAGSYRADICLRYDDQCGNGHNTFSLTASIWGGPWQKQNPRKPVISGACGDIIARYLPEFTEANAFHLCDSNGPMHYPANAIYFAGDRDCHGRRAGEPESWAYGVRFNGVPVTHRIREKLYRFLAADDTKTDYAVYPIAHEKRAGETYDFAPKYNLVGFPASKWHECPFDDETEAKEFCAALNSCTVEFVKVPTAWSKGKARELDAARRVAIWPEATDEELSADPEVLRAALEARRPELVARLRALVEGLGFTF